MHHTPERYIRPDGSSRLSPKRHLVDTQSPSSRPKHASSKPAGSSVVPG